jgi:hypothetical protein
VFLHVVWNFHIIFYLMLKENKNFKNEKLISKKIKETEVETWEET